MKKYRVYGIITSLAMLVGVFGAAALPATAEESAQSDAVIRTNDLEPLIAIRLPDWKVEELRELEAEREEESEATEPDGTSSGDYHTVESYYDTISDAAITRFLECGTDYGYKDMALRNNGSGRRILYDAMLADSLTYTKSYEDALSFTMDGKQYFYAFEVYADGYDFTDDDLVETYFTFRNDHPEFFWLSNTMMCGSSSIFVCAYDIYNTGSVRHAALEEIATTMQDTYIAAADTVDGAYARTLKLHDTLIADISYSEDTEDPISHSIAGAMTSQRSAVCEGYAKVMQLLLNYYDIPIIYVTGIGGGGAHAWDIVQMGNGSWYWMDATWDDQEYEIFRHNYFLKGNNNFADHIVDTPAGVGTDFLYATPTVSDTDYVYNPDDEAVSATVGTIDAAVEAATADANGVLSVSATATDTISKNELKKLRASDQSLAAAIIDGGETVAVWTIASSGIDVSAVAEETSLGLTRGAVGTGSVSESIFASIAGTRSGESLIFTQSGDLGFKAQISYPVDASVMLTGGDAEKVGTKAVMLGTTGHTFWLSGSGKVADGTANVSTTTGSEHIIIYAINGDTTGDGLVDIEDLLNVLYHSSKRKLMSPLNVGIADTNGDNEVDIEDVLATLYYTSGRRSSL